MCYSMSALSHEFGQNCFLKCLLSKNSTAVLEKPCMDADQHHMSPASGISAGNFALMFQVSVH